MTTKTAAPVGGFFVHNSNHMAVKAYIQGNYFILQDGTGLINMDPKGAVSVIQNQAEPLRYIIQGPNLGKHEVLLSDLTDDSATEYTQETWEDFYQFQTGLNCELPQSDYYSEAAMGLLPGKGVVNKWGVNADVDALAPEIVASYGGVFDPLTDIMTDAQTFTITYTNTQDGSGQTGARALLITYLNEDFEEVTGFHTLGSTGADVTSFTGYGINRALVFQNGGAGYNNDDITITATTDGTTQAQIPAQKAVTQQAIFHTQIGHTLLMDWLFINALKDSGGGNPKVTFYMYSWSRVTLTRYDVFEYKLDTASRESLELNPAQKFPFGGREVIWVEAEVSANNTVVAARFSGVQRKN